MAFSCEDLFSLVADVKSYPAFLPWCLGARVRPINDTQTHADLLIGYGALTHSYTSLVTLEAPHKISATQVQGPFRVLNTLWTFSPQGESLTHVHFVLYLELASGIAQKMLGLMMKEASSRMMQAFKERATHLYGNAPKNLQAQ